MMKTLCLSFVGLIAFLSLASPLCAAIPFDPLFRTMKFTGDCSVSIPPSSEFEPAVEGKAYPYGTRVKTGPKSNVHLFLASGNECRAFDDALMTFIEDPKDAKIKGIRLDRGKLEINLEEGFQENKNGFSIQTPIAICTALAGGRFSFEATSAQDLGMVVIGNQDTKLKVNGPQYEIPLVEKDDWVAISTSLDRVFTRIKSVRGDFQLLVKDQDGNPKTIDLKPGMVVKILRRFSAPTSMLLVTVLITDLDGKTIRESISYTEPAKEGDVVPGAPPVPPNAPKATGANETPGTAKGDADWPVISTTTVAPQSTSTTTVPAIDLLRTTTTTAVSPTPVGKR